MNKQCESSALHVCLSLVAPGGLVCFWERETDVSTSSHEGQDSSVGNDVPRQRHRDVLIGPGDETDVTVGQSHYVTNVELHM